jgi:type IV secretion system pilin
MKKILSLIFVTSLLVVPIVVVAESIVIDNPLKAGTIQELIENISGFLFGVAMAVAVIVIVLAGIKFVTAGGEPAKIEEAKKMILYSVIGVAIMILANGLIQIIRNVLGN